MQIRINKTKLRLYCGIIIFILSGHLYLLVGQVMERFFLIVSIPFFYKEYGIIFCYIKRRWIDNLHLVFIICFFIDVALHFTATPIIYAIGMLYVWVISFRIIPYVGKKYGIEFYEWIYKLNLVISLLVIGGSFLVEPIKLRNYTGFFVNPNAFGNYVAFSIAFLFPIFLHCLKQNNKTHNFYILIFLLLIFSVVISSSRTAFLTVLSESIFFVFYVFKITLTKKIKKKLFKKIFYGLLTIILFIVFVLCFTDFLDLLNNAIFNKFVHLSDNQLNGRDEYWKYIWNNSGIFEDGVKDIGAAHNVYFGLIDQFGKLAGIIYLLFIVFSFIKVFLLSLNPNRGFWSYCVVFSGITFILVSMTENYLLTNSMLWFYIMIPIHEVIEDSRKKTLVNYEDKLYE